MKQLLSDFINLFYPKPVGEIRQWGEIVTILFIFGFVIFMVLMFLL